MVDDITFVGLDVSKSTISVGVAPGDPRQAVHYFGTIAHSRNALFDLCSTLSYAGLVPSEHSSGERRSRGSITKAGNDMVRRALVESAWTCRFPPRQSYPIRTRSAHLPELIRDKAWQAQTRLCRRMRYLSGRGKHRNAVLAAVARELAGHVWAIARMVAPMTA